MSTIPNQILMEARAIRDICDRILSGYLVDAECRMLAMIANPDTGPQVRDNLMRGVNWLVTLNDPRRAVAELRKCF